MTKVLDRAEREQIAKRAIADGATLRMLFPHAVVRELDVEEGRKPIEAVINTDDIDHYESIVDPSGAELSDYELNPIVLYDHGGDYQVGNWPVGRCLALTMSAKDIVAKLEFDLESKLHGDANKNIGAELDRLYREKWIRGFSVGFIPVSYEWRMVDGKEFLVYTKWKLVEFSAVAVPGNPRALARSLASGNVQIESSQLRSDLEERIAQATPAEPVGADPKPSADESGVESPQAGGVELLNGQPGFAEFGLALKALFNDCTTLGGDSRTRAGEILDALTALNLSKSTAIDELTAERDSLLARIAAVEGGSLSSGEQEVPAVEAETETPPVDESQSRADEQSVEQPADEKSIRTVRVEWTAPWHLDEECQAAKPEDRAGMAALVDGTKLRMVHHHADGRLNWRALASCLGALLSQPQDLTAEQKDAIYEHLAAHCRELGIEPPAIGHKSPDQAYDLALEGRMARIDRAGYAWLYRDCIDQNGVMVPRFERIDEPTVTRLGHVPTVGRLTDHRQWGQRSQGQPSASEAMLRELADTQRELLALKQNRAGAEFSQKNKTRITNAANELEQLAASLEAAVTGTRAAVTYLRGMIEQQAEEETKGAGGAKRDSDPKDDSATPEPGTGFKRPV